MKSFRFTFLALILIAGGQVPMRATAAPLQITKTYAIASNGVDLTGYRAIPGAVIDYTVTVKNPNIYTTSAISVTDAINTIAVPQGAEYYVGLSGANPVIFTDGSLLGLGLGGSNLSYSFVALGNTADSVSFSCDGGVSFTCTPNGGTSGYDPTVTHIKVSPTGTFAAGSGFSVTFRVRVKQ